MAVTPEDLAAGALALQVFIKNAQYVEVIVNVAFGAIPSILGIGAAGLIGSGVINTARDVMHSINLIRTLGPGGRALYLLNARRWEIAERWQQGESLRFRIVGYILGPDVFVRSLFRRRRNT
jgi:hypothetical protein